MASYRSHASAGDGRGCRDCDPAGRGACHSHGCPSISSRRSATPAIYVAQPYGGMDPAQMEGYLTYYYEYHFLYITGIDHVESKSIQGAALMKLVFHRGHRHEPGDGARPSAT